MKYYSLSGMIQQKAFKANKSFASRNLALEYMFKLFSKKGINAQVDEIVERSSKHDLEYICDSYNRFIISRHLTK